MVPNTTVYLFQTPFDITNEFVIKAANESDAWGIVSSFPHIIKTNCYWQRTAGFVFRCDGNINDLEIYNYCVFENNGKRNYAFITSMQYVNDAMTWIYLEIDAWLNFAGKYTFELSPMVRCHPVVDSYGSLGANYFPEPYTVQRENAIEITECDADEDDDLFFIVTTIPIDAFSGYTSQRFVDAQAQLMAGVATQNMVDWYNMQSVRMTRVNGGIAQACTSLGNRQEAEQTLELFTRFGCADYILAIYHVPKKLRIPQNNTANIPIIAENSQQLLLNSPTWLSTIHWNKIKYSPQFNKISMNLCGSTKFIPTYLYNPNTVAEGNIAFSLSADVGLNGRMYLRPYPTQNGENPADYMITSPMWDRGQITAYAVNKFDTISNQLSYEVGTASNLINATAGTLRNAFNLNIGGALQSMAQSAVDQYQLDTTKELRDAKTEIAGGKVIGTPSTSIAGYNKMSPLARVTRYYPSETDCNALDKLFATYGYMQGGTIQPIGFHMPKWDYFHTVNACITGDSVPQKYLNIIINRFNAGIFVFANVSSYKKFSAWGENHL